jgi:hypothetical protein
MDLGPYPLGPNKQSILQAIYLKNHSHQGKGYNYRGSCSY